MADLDQYTQQPEINTGVPFNLPEPPKLDEGITPPLESVQSLQNLKALPELQRKAAELKQREIESGRLVEINKAKQEEYAAKLDYQTQQAAKRKVDEIVNKENELKKKFPYPEFNPTQDNINYLSTLFGGFSILMTAMGGSGRMSAMNALNSMTGMLKGYREGRADLYAREKDKFEAEYKRIKQILDDIKSDTDRALERMAYDVNESNAYAKQAVAKLGSQIASQIANNQGIGKLSEYVNDLVKTAEALEKERQNRASQDTDLYLASDKKVYRINKMVDIDTQIKQQGGQPGTTIVGKLGALGTGRSGASGQGGVIQFRYNAAMVNAGNLLANELENYADSLITSMPPVLGDAITNPQKGVTQAVIDAAGRQMTTLESRAVQQTLAAVERAIVNIEASGRPGGATESAFKEIRKVVPQANDSIVNAYLFMGIAKQHFDLLVKDLQASGATDDQINQAIAARDRVNQMIPFNSKDIYRIIRGGGSKLINETTNKLIRDSQNVDSFLTRIDQLEKGPTAEHIKKLKNNPTPEMKNYFDEIYGAGSANRALGAK